ncbi:glycosyltransferase [Sphingobacteriaceae bacterium]|nr:glycosyltransferase [Sphingobacteriaceae bacterium]
MISGKTIFICALDWGLGHATRCVPIIRKLIKNNKVIIGTTALTEKIFQLEFPHLQRIAMPAYNVRYSSVLPVWLKLLVSGPRIFRVIKKENELIQRLILEHKIDVVISDNRFGLFSKTTHSIFITHQVFLKTPFANSIAQSINKKYILNFNEVWIPDYEREAQSLGGELSHGKHFHATIKYIEPQSRLQKKNPAKIKYDYLILLSGPEPQYSILKNLLLQKAEQQPELLFAFAMPVELAAGQNIPSHIQVFFSKEKNILSDLINESATVICRSGYSTLMDLHLLDKKKLILIPTPGQTEQEYLADYWEKTFGARKCAQEKLRSLKF